MRTIIVLREMNNAVNKTPLSSPLARPKRVPSELLLGPKRELVITHNGREYRLRVTQNGKLILTA